MVCQIYMAFNLYTIDVGCMICMFVVYLSAHESCSFREIFEKLMCSHAPCSDRHNSFLNVFL
jgi:hypothetical protein